MRRWARVKKADHLAAKRVANAMFALVVSLHCANYFAEEDLESYRLAQIDEDDISLPPAASGPSTMMPPGK